MQLLKYIKNVAVLKR